MKNASKNLKSAREFNTSKESPLQRREAQLAEAKLVKNQITLTPYEIVTLVNRNRAIREGWAMLALAVSLSQ